MRTLNPINLNKKTEKFHGDFEGFHHGKNWILPIINAKKFILANLEQPITQQDICTNSLHIQMGVALWDEVESEQKTISAWLDVCMLISFQNRYIYIYQHPPRGGV